MKPKISIPYPLSPMNQLTRAEHLQWCKDRALEYVELGDLETAILSMQSDIKKHPETTLEQSIEVALLQILFSQPRTAANVRHWIQSFN
jgi:hypothetical protein